MFYDRFVDLCSKKGVTPLQVRKELKISQSTMASWKSRGLTPSAATLAKIAEYFGVSVNDLLNDREKISTAIDIAARSVYPNSSDKSVHHISFDTTPDPEWTDLYQKLESGTITPDELQRWKDLQVQCSVNTQKALAAMMERLRVHMDLLNAVGREEAMKRVEELTEIPKYQKAEEPADGD